MNTMTMDEAKSAGVGSRHSFVRIDDAKANLANTGERSTRGTSAFASIAKALPAAVFFDANSSVTGTSTVGIVVVPPFAGSPPTIVYVLPAAACVNVGTVPCAIALRIDTTRSSRPTSLIRISNRILS